MPSLIAAHYFGRQWPKNVINGFRREHVAADFAARLPLGQQVHQWRGVAALQLDDRPTFEHHPPSLWPTEGSHRMNALTATPSAAALAASVSSVARRITA